MKNGFKAATVDLRQVAAWWRAWPDANIGIATGSISGIVVVDIDGADGEVTLKALIANNELPPHCEVVETARGRHIWFQLPDDCAPVPCSSCDGLDVRGDGGYVVAPPSLHHSGHRYSWA